VLFDPANIHPANPAWTPLHSWHRGLSILK
jgi:hypothetical protein